jgi:phage shock protein A
MSRLIRANINDMLDRAEDPEKMLNELLREMEGSIREARVQVANMIAQEKDLESDLQEAQRDGYEWGRRAELAVGSGKDDLAREALRRKRDAENIATIYAQQLTSQQEMVTRLKHQLTMLEAKHDEAESKRNVLVARHRATRAQRQVTETMSQLPGLDSYSELERMERRIRSEESRTAAIGELQGEDVEWQFAELDRDEDIESELMAIKAQLGGGDPPKSLDSGSPGAQGSSSSTSTSGGTSPADTTEN